MRYLALIFLLLILAVPIVYAADTVLEVGIPGVPGAEPGAHVSSIVQYISFLYTFVLGFVGIAGFASIVVWGAVWAGSGIIDKKRQALDGIKNALYGIGITLTAFIILNTINPDLTVIKLPLISEIGLTSREITMITTGELDSKVADLARQLILNAKTNLGIDLHITTGYRSPQQQAKEYAEGDGVPPCKSYHQYGLAFDIAIVSKRNSNGIPEAYNWNGDDYRKIGEIGRSFGLTWGGDWKRKDMVHFEYRNGKNIATLEQQCFQSYNGA